MKAFEYARGLYTDNVTSEIKTAVGVPDHLGSNLLWRDDDEETRGVYVDTDTLCYSTGLVDRKGKDIFTGDILQSFDPACPVGQLYDVGKVVWLDAEAAFFVEIPPAVHTEYRQTQIIVHHEKVYRRLNRESAKFYTIKEEPKNE